MKTSTLLTLAISALLPATVQAQEEPSTPSEAAVQRLQEMEVLPGEVTNLKTECELALRKAAEDGDTKVVKLLLETGVDVDAMGESTPQALFEACSYGHLDVVELLLQVGAKADKKDVFNRTPMYAAFLQMLRKERDNSVIIQRLLQAGANPNAVIFESKKLTAIMLAAATSTNATRILLEAGADTEAVDDKGANAFLYAVAADKTENAKLIMAKGADVKTADKEGVTPLMQAAKNKNGELVKLLLEAGVDVNATDAKGGTALWHAVCSDSVEVARLLFDAGAQPKHSGSMYDLVFPAIYNGNAEMIKLLQANGANFSQDSVISKKQYLDSFPKEAKELLGGLMNSVDSDEIHFANLALTYAAFLDNEEIIRIILETGADPNGECISGFTPLHAACFGIDGYVLFLDQAGAEFEDILRKYPAGSAHKLEIVRLLLSHGANVEAVDETKSGVLMQAAAFAKPDVVKELLKAGASVKVANNEGVTPLMTAAIFGRADNMKVLLDAGADLHARNCDGQTALLVACYQQVMEEGTKEGGACPRPCLNRTGAVAFLLRAGAEVDAKDKDGNTALILAACCEKTDIARLLLAAKADVNIQDKDGRTPLMYAVAFKNAAMVKLLLEAGADATLKDNEGMTAAYFADSDEIQALLPAPADAPEDEEEEE